MRAFAQVLDVKVCVWLGNFLCITFESIGPSLQINLDMQEAAKSSTAFGRIRSFESLVGTLPEQPSHVKPMAKKLPKKSKGVVGAKG